MILDSLDNTNSLFSHRLYREHTVIQNNTAVKDLSKINRDLSKTIIVDNLSENFMVQPHNGLPIKTWEDDLRDVEMKYLKEILKEIVLRNVEDVRKTVRKIKESAPRTWNSQLSYSSVSIEKVFS